jgi:hypothetical protein
LADYNSNGLLTNKWIIFTFKFQRFFLIRNSTTSHLQQNDRNQMDFKKSELNSASTVQLIPTQISVIFPFHSLMLVASNEISGIKRISRIQYSRTLIRHYIYTAVNLIKINYSSTNALRRPRFCALHQVRIQWSLCRKCKSICGLPFVVFPPNSFC